MVGEMGIREPGPIKAEPLLVLVRASRQSYTPMRSVLVVNRPGEEDLA